MLGADGMWVRAAIFFNESISEFLSFGLVLAGARLGWQPPSQPPNPAESRNSKTKKTMLVISSRALNP